MNILLDFDGVVFDNKRVQSLVTEKSVEFLQHKLRLCPKQARFVNSSTYPVKGHTALICENHQEAIHEYNAFVFSKRNLERVASLVDPNDRTHWKRVTSLRKYIRSGYRFSLCTNATRGYCEAILDELDAPLADCFDHVFTSEQGFVKPQRDYYAHVEHTLPEGKLVLIDDSPLNILGVSAESSRWDAVLINRPQDLHTFLEVLVSDNIPSDNIPSDNIPAN
jgi:FMN phosphatase YigB (HAD superfamily)